MKKCPKCSRTYADDGFTFCLEDGALLSAPYDPTDGNESSTPQSSGPQPTVVLPATSDGEPDESRTHARERVPPASTIASPAPQPRPRVVEQWASSQSRNRSKLPYILAGGALLVLGAGILGLLGYRRAQCPNISVDCNQVGAYVYCSVREQDTSSNHLKAGPALASLRVILGFQEAAPPRGVTNIRWSTSAGNLATPNSTSAQIEITGLFPDRTAGKEITVTANYLTDGLFCSNHASAKFMVLNPH